MTDTADLGFAHAGTLPRIEPGRPVLIAGPTASGKSALALAIAGRFGGDIVNADALQVFDRWCILTARPDATDLARAPHHLYGHVAFDAPYSVGAWLTEVSRLLQERAGDVRRRPIIVGGTGLYFAALTGGLAPIPPTPAAVRAEADTLPLAALLDGLDPDTQGRLDSANRARVQRAWEVLRATGRGLASWQAATPPPLLPLAAATAICLVPETDWLNARIARRFEAMLAQGALDEARAMLPDWNPGHASSRAIGAAALMAHLQGDLSLSAAREAVVVATRNYGKRQRTWFRSRRMDGWTRIAPT